MIATWHGKHLDPIENPYLILPSKNPNRYSLECWPNAFAEYIVIELELASRAAQMDAIFLSVRLMVFGPWRTARLFLSGTANNRESCR